MRRPCRFLILTAALGFAASPVDAAPQVASSPEPMQELDAWQERLACGRNALYLFLRAHGCDMSLADVGRCVPVGDRGCSLGDLERAARLLQTDVRIVRTNLRELQKATYPAIVLLEASERAAVSATGHFVLVTDVDSTGVEVMDTTSTYSTRIAPDYFQRHWTGYALVLDRSPHLLLWAVNIMSIGAGVLVCGYSIQSVLGKGQQGARQPA